jgi:hypothetical protein
LNGTSIFEQGKTDFPTFIKSAYKALDTDYSKFFKMDNLSKLAFMAADILLKEEMEKNVALVLSNKASSLDTDRKHQKSIANSANFYPSPSVFVYTLPNICLGEISIKHGLYSENAFFVFDKFNPSALKDYADSLMQEDNAKKVLSGWVNFDNGKYDAFLYVVANKGTFAHTTEQLIGLYRTI